MVTEAGARPRDAGAGRPAAGKAGLNSKRLAQGIRPNLHAVNLAVSLMLAVALVIVAGWLVVSVNKIEELEKSLVQSRVEIQKIGQTVAMNEAELVDYLDQVQAGLSAIDGRTKVIEGRLNIGKAKRVVGSPAGGSAPPTRRIIQDDGSLVIKTPLVE